MLTILPPSYTLTDESLQELLSSSSSSSSSSSDTAGSTASPSEACYLIFFSSTLPALLSEKGEVEKGLPLSESDLASLKEGLWCPDCRIALQPVLSVFQPGALPPATATAEEGSEPRALLVQVSREQWKDRFDGGHFYRKRYDVQSVPTILKWLGGKEVGRLVDDECADVGKVRALKHG